MQIFVAGWEKQDNNEDSNLSHLFFGTGYGQYDSGRGAKQRNEKFFFQIYTYMYRRPKVIAIICQEKEQFPKS